ncbi:MAG: hypothetical protein GXP27_06595, partial [Planctomycetes bacterium]|nr:hypothetical protein [Planctomycetota bacterium]
RHGHWVWASRDVPLVTFGGPHVLARRKTAPDDAHRILAMIFNNRWYTNFVADSHGVFEFQFDLAWKKHLDPTAVGALAEALQAEPLVLINPAATDEPLYIKHLYRP